MTRFLSVSKIGCFCGHRGRFVRDTGGVAAVEFALIALLMVGLLFGIYAISSGVAIYRKVTMAAQTVSDLVSRSKTATDTDITSATNIAKAMLNPYPDTPLKVTITEIWIDSSGIGRVQWSDGTLARSPGTQVTVPTALVARDSSNKVVANQYLIYSEVSYPYTPTVNWRLSSSLSFEPSEKTFTRPRLSVCVQRSPKVETDPCPTTSS